MAADDEITPAGVEARIREVSNEIARGVRIVSDRYATFLEADRHYDQQFAAAYLDHAGPAHEKKHAAELETREAREVKDVADVAYKYARDRAKALEEELRAMQSVGASLREQYAVAGRGEW